MSELLSAIKSTIHEELKDLGIDYSGSATFYLPEVPVREIDELENLYRVILGAGTVSSQRCLIADNMSVSDLAIALVGAFFFVGVFEARNLPAVDDYLASLRGTAGSIHERLEEVLMRGSNTNIDTLVRRAWLADIQTPGFQQLKLRPQSGRSASLLIAGAAPEVPSIIDVAVGKTSASTPLHGAVARSRGGNPGRNTGRCR
ncbi:hypothetical protein LTR08_005727 [Meristemomyces frigidus]|nr:hypothetical protein LTR08_005727 [Meristemomyces frigidus]